MEDIFQYKEFKQNIQFLQKQNNLQQDQTPELAHFLNLTIVQVSQHWDVLYELHKRLVIVNKTLLATINAVSHLSFSMAILTDIHTSVTFLTLGLISSKETVDTLYEYIRVLARHLVNPIIVHMMI